jgi:hypothetical protein
MGEKDETLPFSLPRVMESGFGDWGGLPGLPSVSTTTFSAPPPSYGATVHSDKFVERCNALTGAWEGESVRTASPEGSGKVQSHSYLSGCGAKIALTFLFAIAQESTSWSCKILFNSDDGSLYGSGTSLWRGREYEFLLHGNKQRSRLVRAPRLLVSLSLDMFGACLEL